MGPAGILYSAVRPPEEYNITSPTIPENRSGCTDPSGPGLIKYRERCIELSIKSTKDQDPDGFFHRTTLYLKRIS